MDIRQYFLEDKIPLEDNIISTIICNQAIEHISPETAVFMLKECYRILKKGGVIFVYSLCKYDKRQRKEVTHINLYTPNRLRMELENVGFRVKYNLNSPRAILGNFTIGKYIVKVIYKLFPIDFLSDTANYVAFKPI